MVEASWYDLLPSQLTPAVAVHAVDIGFGRIITSDIEIPNMLVNMV